uniref:(northern house mosquito) hypothetical protein n=1 Tax=Culex pipiens TaxID=7175 RepID=A0A8D8PES9_CULPI
MTQRLVQVVPVARVVDLEQALLAKAEMLRCVTYVSVGGRDRDRRGRIDRRRHRHQARPSGQAHTDYAGAARSSPHRAVSGLTLAASGGVQRHVLNHLLLLAGTLEAIRRGQRVVVAAAATTGRRNVQQTGMVVVGMVWGNGRKGKGHVGTAAGLVVRFVRRRTRELQLGKRLGKDNGTSTGGRLAEARSVQPQRGHGTVARAGMIRRRRFQICKQRKKIKN